MMKPLAAPLLEGSKEAFTHLKQTAMHHIAFS